MSNFVDYLMKMSSDNGNDGNNENICYFCKSEIEDKIYNYDEKIYCKSCYNLVNNICPKLQSNYKEKEDKKEKEEKEYSKNNDETKKPSLITFYKIYDITDKLPETKKQKVDNEDKTDKTEKTDKKGKEKPKKKQIQKTSCCDDKNSDDEDNLGNLFFRSLINDLDRMQSERRNGLKLTINNTKNNNTTINNTTIDNEDDSDYEYEWLGNEINNIDDLIRLGQSYNPKKRKRYNLNLKRLNLLVEPLIELKNMIGMTDVKKVIFDQIIYYLQKLDDKNVDMLHTVIVGPPGVGKTQLTHIIAKIYNRLGFLKTDKVISAKRDDLIAEYVGQTAPKTRKVLEKALGGVLLLDEIYSLAPTSDRDFAHEAIDMINMYLSEHCHDLVCVIAGYKKPTYEKFFSQNEGLARRFTHHFEIKGYTPEELTLIFKKYIEEQKWEMDDSIESITQLIEKNMSIFPHFGGDMTSLFACCKKTHSRRLLLIPTEAELLETKKKLKIKDIENGIKLFLDLKEKSKSAEQEDKGKYMHMYS